MSEQVKPESEQKRLIGWRTDNFLWETSDPDKARNWEGNIGVLPIFEGDVNTKLAPHPDYKAQRDALLEALEAVLHSKDKRAMGLASAAIASVKGGE